MKQVLITILCLYCGQYAQSQKSGAPIPYEIQLVAAEKPDCDSIILVNTENVHDINSLYQLTFLNEEPKTSLDVLVKKIIGLNDKDMIADHQIAIDLFDSIGQLRTEDAYRLLYVLCETTFEEWSDKPIRSGVLGRAYSFDPINKYFLHNSVNKLSNQNYIWDIRAEYSKNPPIVYFCVPEDPEKKYVRLASKINTSQYDREIIDIIKKHSDLRDFGGFVEYYKAFDTILKVVNRLDYVTDAYFDFCQVKLLLYPGNSTLGVMLNVDGKSIEKSYDIQVGAYGSKKSFFGRNIKKKGNLDKLIYLNNYIKRGFISHQKELCHPIPKEEDMWKVKYDVARNIIFKDTVNDFVVDSLFHDLGQISSENFQIIKFFKYIGTETVSLNTINDDPHFITEFNQTTLVKDQVYQYSVIFHCKDEHEIFESEMGFELSNGHRIMFRFRGNYSDK